MLCGGHCCALTLPPWVTLILLELPSSGFDGFLLPGFKCHCIGATLPPWMCRTGPLVPLPPYFQVALSQWWLRVPPWKVKHQLQVGLGQFWRNFLSRIPPWNQAFPLSLSCFPHSFSGISWENFLKRTLALFYLSNCEEPIGIYEVFIRAFQDGKTTEGPWALEVVKTEFMRGQGWGARQDRSLRKVIIRVWMSIEKIRVSLQVCLCY